MSNEIIFHSSHCPRCLILEKKLKEKGIMYKENNDIDIMLSKGLETAPALEIDGVMKSYKEAVEWLKGQ